MLEKTITSLPVIPYAHGADEASRATGAGVPNGIHEWDPGLIRHPFRGGPSIPTLPTFEDPPASSKVA